MTSMIPRSLERGAVGAVLVLLALALLVSRCQLADARDSGIQAEHDRDSLAADAAAARARSAGWAVAYADSTGELRERLEARDSQMAVLARDLHASRVRITDLTSITASAEGSIESEGVVHAPAPPTLSPDSVTGDLDDGLLRGSWSFYPRGWADPRLRLDYSATIRAELVRSVTGDGRVLVTARALHRRAHLAVDSVVWDPPEPVIVERCGIRCTAIRAGIGVLGGVIAVLVAGG